LTGFYSNYPTQEILDEMFKFFTEKKLTPVSGKVFAFENIKDAVMAQESGSVNGKIIVEVTDR
jgi:NADPH:quinone reductase-like Zn-dependent oxidoreductase